MITRRVFLKDTATGLARAAVVSLVSVRAAEPAVKIRIGSCRLNLAQAKQAGVEGIELVVNGTGEKLQISNPDIRADYKKQMADTGVAVSSLMMSLLNSNPLATTPHGPTWLEQCIEAAKDLQASVILVAFFGKGDLLQEGQLKAADVATVVQRLQAAAPRAKAAGVILAIENRLSAQQNLEILDKIAQPSVGIYYDVGNSTGMGYDVPAEIRLLKKRIACIHFKDRNSYLGEGKINFPDVAAAIKEIGYQGWIVMETANPSGNAVDDAKRNAAYIRKLFGVG